MPRRGECDAGESAPADARLALTDPDAPRCWVEYATRLEQHAAVTMLGPLGRTWLDRLVAASPLPVRLELVPVETRPLGSKGGDGARPAPTAPGLRAVARCRDD